MDTASPVPATPESPVPITTLPTSTKFIDPQIIIATSASAISARLCTHPLDTIRIKIQTYPGVNVPPFRELFPKAGRWRTLYAGLPVAVGLSVPALSIYLTSYEASKRFFGKHLLPESKTPTLMQQIPVFLLAGTAAEITSGLFWTPLEVLKSRLQKGEKETSTVKLLAKIWREEGYRGVWRGYWVSMAIYIPSVSLYWMLYETFKTRYIPSYDAYKPATASTESATSLALTARYTLCSVVACAISASVVNPIELVQSRWQTSAGKGGGVKAIVKELWKQGGVLAFSRGLGVRVMYAIPANGISMTVYESFKRWKGI
ncbi:mitochondrial carrier [Meredithblackwellia eburnea MCA 4105]